MFSPVLLDCLKTYSRRDLLADLLAGVTVGVVALPLAMAFAIASGLPPERGLFTAIVAGFLISLLGGSRVQIGGPTGAFVVIVSGIAAEYGYEGLVWCTLLAGGLLVAMGLARMGALIRYIPYPVTTGFTTGIAVVIFTTQVPDLIGLRLEDSPSGFAERWWAYFQAAGTIHWGEAAIGLGTIGGIIAVRRLDPRVPAMLVGMVGATVVAWAGGLDVATIGSRFGDLPRTLPQPGLPSIDLATLRELVSPAFTVGLLAAIESLLSATVADGMTGKKHRPNVELVAQGLANMGSVVFGGIPATGAIARTATNVRSGARTPVAGIIHAATLFLLLLLLAPLAREIPLAALAGILVVVSYNMAELDRFRSLLNAPRSDVMVLLSTFALTVLVDLTVAVEVGVVMASLLFIRRMAEVSTVDPITQSLKDGSSTEEDPLSLASRDVPHGVEVFEVQGAFFFGAAEKFKETMGSLERPPRLLVLRMRFVWALDATGMHVLEDLLRTCRRDGTGLILSGVQDQPRQALARQGLLDRIGAENVLPDIDRALDRARELLATKL